MEKKQIITQSAPAAIGPYSQAITAGGFLFTAGQIALDPASGTLITQNIEEETHRVMQNLHAVLLEAGCDWKDAVKATVYVKDIGMFARINAVYASYFEGVTPPARELVQVSELPRGVHIEISLIALIPAAK